MSYKNALVIGLSLILVTLLLQCQEMHGKEFLVGDEKGWSPYPGISDWPNGKNFTPGDVLSKMDILFSFHFISFFP